ncbi:MAG: DUF4838 domain-containing protein [Clostridia bacterium]|nr:DUF4838 domain-containing protein [Clostridia bacterium]
MDQNGFTLAENRTALVSIRIPAEDLSNPASPVLTAAKELRYYLGRITAASIPVLAADDPEGPAKAISLGAASGLDVSSCSEDGFIIESDCDSVKIGGGKRGVLYGAYDLLERLGCRFFTPLCEKVPTDPGLSIPPIRAKEEPVFEFRRHNYADIEQYPRFAAKRRFNGAGRIPERLGGNLTYAMHVHTFDQLVPARVYGKEHPEYFAEVNGQRVTTDGGRTQLCLSNPDVLALVIEKTREFLRSHPGHRLMSISQNDWGGNCTCENCKRIDEEEGSSSGTLLRFVNAVAEALEPEFPDIVFDTLAYTYSRPAPKYVRNRKNVCVRLCSIECCFCHPFDACDDESRGVMRPDGTRSNFITDLREWGKICDRMYIWDYTTCFAHYPTPHPNWRILARNAQLMAENNVKGVFEQANGASRGGVDFNELRAYLVSKLLWDPYCDIETHRREFMEYFYGPAAEALDEYLNLLCDTCGERGDHVGFNDNPLHGFLEEDMLDRYNALFDRAAEAVKGDPVRLARVEKNRLSIRWVALKRKTMLRGEYDAEEINRFFGDWKAFGLSRIDEWCNVETTHRALLEGKWRGVEYFDHWTGEAPEDLG